MSQRPISLSPDLKRLRDEGYQVEIRSAHLLVHGVPYVNSHRQIARGILASTLMLAGDTTRPPDTHIAYFIGEYPCNTDGSEVDQIRLQSRKFCLGEQLTADHSFSSKPLSGRYVDYYEKMATYATIISSPASSIDQTVTPKSFAPVPADDGESPFTYVDTASSRAGIGGLSGRLAVDRIAIVETGPTPTTWLRPYGCCWWSSSASSGSPPRCRAGSPPPPPGSACGYCGRPAGTTTTSCPATASSIPANRR